MTTVVFECTPFGAGATEPPSTSKPSAPLFRTHVLIGLFSFFGFFRCADAILHGLHERLRLSADPPEALIATIAWDSGDGEVTGVNVWETPGAIADFFLERVRPFLEAEGEPPNKPQRHGEPLAFYLRP